jgi:hypothetical protein
LYIDFQATFPDLDVSDLSLADREELMNARTSRMDAFIVKWSRLIPDALEPVAVRTRASDRHYALDDNKRAIPVCRLIWYCIEIMRGRLGMNDVQEPGK